MISLSNVTKIYHTRNGERRVLDDVSFSIERGQSIGILGRNGSGKSTLTRLIGGVEYPTSGKIRRSMSVSWPLGLAGGFQSSLTGADNARFIARIYGAPIDSLVKYVDEFAELGNYMRMPVKTYSSGMRARLAFGISLAIHFDCYLIDEVTAVGDVRFKERCERAILERSDRSALVMVSHDTNTLKTYCKMGAVLFDGKLTVYDDVDQAGDAYTALMEAIPS
jgi:capsular polysaccharide transport system ATP-binding protein